MCVGERKREIRNDYLSRREKFLQGMRNSNMLKKILSNVMRKENFLVIQNFSIKTLPFFRKKNKTFFQHFTFKQIFSLYTI